MKEFKGSHDYFDVPVYRVSRVDEIVPDAKPTMYELSIGGGMVLHLIARVVAKPNRSLTVVSHGAKEPSAGLPYFNRFASLSRTDRSFILVSDPTLALDSSMTLAWYLGTSAIDPLDVVARVVGHVAEQCDFTGIMFEGSSGGGFSSLRLAARFPNSLALVFSPQTNAFKYEAGAVADKVKDRFFDGGVRSRALEQFPDRFSVVDLYARLSRERCRPFVYYVQNSGDGEHVRLQMHPFLDAIAEGGARDHRLLPTDVHVAMLDQGPGHIRPSLEIWEEHEEIALRILEGLTGSKSERRKGAQISDSFVTSSRLENQVSGSRLSQLSGLVDFTSDSGRVLSAYMRGDSLAPSLLRVFLHPASASHELVRSVVDAAIEPPRETLDVHVLDQLVLDHSELRVGWFIGPREWDLSETVVELVARVKELTFSRNVLVVGASSGGFAALMLKTRMPEANVLAFAPDVALCVYSNGHRERFLDAGGFEPDDWEDVATARRLDLTRALSAAPIRGPKPQVLLNSAAIEYELTQLSYLIAQTVESSTEKAWLQLGADAEFIDYGSSIQRPAPHVYAFHLNLASEEARGKARFLD